MTDTTMHANMKIIIGFAIQSQPLSLDMIFSAPAL